MFPYTKFLRITLPVATGACAIVATSLLISWTNDKDKLKKDENDEILKDLEKNPEEFKEEVITKPDNNEQSEEKQDSEKGKGESSSKEQKQATEEEEAEARKKLREKLLTNAEEIVIGDTTVTVGGEGTEATSPEELGAPNQVNGEDQVSVEILGPEEAVELPLNGEEEQEADVDAAPAGEADTELSISEKSSKDSQEDQKVEKLEEDTSNNMGAQDAEKEIIEPSSKVDEGMSEEEKESVPQDEESLGDKATDQEDAGTQEAIGEAGGDEEARGEDHGASDSSDASSGEKSEGGEEGDSESGSAESPLTEEQLQTFLSYQEATERTIGSLGKLLFGK